MTFADEESEESESEEEKVVKVKIIDSDTLDLLMRDKGMHIPYTELSCSNLLTRKMT